MCTTVLLLHVVLGSRRVAVVGLEGSRGRRKSLTQEKQQEDLYKSRACGSRDVEIPFDSRQQQFRPGDWTQMLGKTTLSVSCPSMSVCSVVQCTAVR